MTKIKEVIYLDNNATTPIDKRVLNEMMPYLTNNFANANSTHQFGLGAYESVKIARSQVANLIGADTNEIVFTSGATEAINLAIKGIAENYSNKGKHIITVATEHRAVLDTCEYLEGKGFDVTYLPVMPDGMLDLSVLKGAMRTDTILVSVMYANNETGVMQPLREISEIAHKGNAIFMTDCTQAIGKVSVNVNDLGIDLLCFSGHKIYAPKGVGVLYVRQTKKRIKIPALIHGCGHERGLRSGTLNVPGIVGIGKACELAKEEMPANEKQITKLRNYVEKELLSIENTSINGNTSTRMFNVTNVCFHGVDSDALIIGLSNNENDQALIALSNGSACTSTNIEPSHVLMAMFNDEARAYCSIRISLGKFNTKNELAQTVLNIKNVVTHLKKMA